MSKSGLYSVARAGSVPADRVIGLTAEQANSRQHLLEPVSEQKGPWRGNSRRSFRTTGAVYFKAGEKLAIDGDLDRGLEILFGLNAGVRTTAQPATTGATPEEIDEALKTAHAAGKAEGRAEMLTEVEARNKLFDDADAALNEVVAAEDEAARIEAQKRVDTLQAEIDALPELKA